VEFGFQRTNYSVTEQAQFRDVGVCVVLNNGTLEREIEITFNVIDVTAESTAIKYYYTYKFSPGEIFTNFAICSHWQAFTLILLSRVYRLRKVYDNLYCIGKVLFSTKISWNTKVAGFGEIFIERKFSRTQYIKLLILSVNHPKIYLERVKSMHEVV
jgi:hypothetical protein